MINKNTVQKAIIVILSALLITTWCGLFGIVFNPDSIPDPSRPPPGYPYSGSYKIDASTILKSIDSGQSPIFLPETTQIPNSNTSDNLKWTQSEYLKVAFALFEFEWKEGHRNWTINRMVFHRACEENPVGFEDAKIIFDQLIYQEEFRYSSRVIEISLPDGTASWGSGGATHPRPLFGDNEYYLSDLKITANDALRIAEENGGKAARQSIQNKCTLGLYLDENWDVIYYGPLINHSTTLFEIHIDPYTGKIIKTWTNR
ncbi:MAG: PepSY domain-containing protein [Anaerolineales bacterium]|nr:PepSY domain-containing protein [Anaerolineales bacterium]